MGRREGKLGVSARILATHREDTRLSVSDWGGRGPVTVCVHGLAGWSGEWAQTAWRLSDRSRVVAVDLRGHGESERHPVNRSLQAAVDDLVHVIELLQLAPVVVIGQSLGGLVALRLAASRPDLVRGLVMVEAAPADGDRELADRAADNVEASLRAWPTPFTDLSAAAEFFNACFGTEQAGFTWATGLEPRPDGLWPRFDPAVVTDLLRDALAQPSWSDWRAVRCPTLVVRGDRGTLAADTVRRMVEALPAAQTATLPAGHDVHLDAPPERWSRTLKGFLDRLPV